MRLNSVSEMHQGRLPNYIIAFAPTSALLVCKYIYFAPALVPVRHAVPPVPRLPSQLNSTTAGIHPVSRVASLFARRAITSIPPPQTFRPKTPTSTVSTRHAFPFRPHHYPLGLVNINILELEPSPARHSASNRSAT